MSATERAVRLVSLPTSDHAFAEQLQRAEGTRIEVAWHAEVRGLRLHAGFRPVQEGS